MEKKTLSVRGRTLPVYVYNTVVIGSGAASLSCADHIHNLGQTDCAIVTEKVGGGVSFNSGSDKQTYYKLSVFGKEGDSPYEMAKSLYDGGSMHGDLALIEALLSPRCFFRLVEIGVPFPHDRLGGYVGYKTDHDPRQRATSCGPWTSREMVSALLKEIKRRGIPLYDDHDVIGLIADERRIYGVAAIDKHRLGEPSFGLTLFMAENVVFGVGGPGGLYASSVYPQDHTGGIGLALEIGAKAVNLTESQYGLASIKFRWNVSGTYQQVIPRYISTDKQGGDEKEFLNPYFPTMGRLATDIFLKGYQWPFDYRKIAHHGSSLIDLLVYREISEKGRRVFMDFRDNPRGGDGLPPFSFDALEKEASAYLENSGALFGRPIDRLKKMNPPAVDLYRENGIDLEKEILEVAVCSQHNNGGLEGDIWWESNIRHLFPIGEVNGSHGVTRPGGSALNSGQVGSLRAAQRIVHAYSRPEAAFGEFEKAAIKKTEALLSVLERLTGAVAEKSDLPEYRDRFERRMSDFGAHIREIGRANRALSEAYGQFHEVNGIKIVDRKEIPLAMKLRHLVFAHIAYLESIKAYLEAGGGSRGSTMVLDPAGAPVLEDLLEEWRYKPEDEHFRSLVLETAWNSKEGRFETAFSKRRPIPPIMSWFETVWGDYLEGKIFDESI